MKAQTVDAIRYYSCRLPGAHKLPNAATKRYYLEKLVDSLLAAAITLAAVVVMVVLVTM